MSMALCNGYIVSLLYLHYSKRTHTVDTPLELEPDAAKLDEVLKSYLNEANFLYTV